MILAVLISLIQLPAQTEDPELSDRLKSVMALFEKNQESLKQEIAELNASNVALTKANLKLYQDLKSAEEDLKSLEAENALLREKLSQIAVNEFESASLSTPRITTEEEANEVEEPPTSNTPGNSPVASTTTSTDPLLNVNTATLEELESLPTIDEAMAEQIISNRPYKTLEDLIINQGFGPMKLRRISPFVTVE